MVAWLETPPFPLSSLASRVPGAEGALRLGRVLTVGVNLQPWYTRAAGSQLPPLAARPRPRPRARPHTASTVLRASRALATAAAVLGELVLELPGHGIPVFISPNQEITCEVCGRTATAETYRRVETGSHGLAADVCAVRAAAESRE
jgi:hypothetical protein